MKKAYLVILILAGVWGVDCVSPYYGTARIEPGWNLNIGAGLHTTIIPVLDAGPFYGIGIRFDGEAGYGYANYLRPYARACLGLNTAYIGYADIGVGLHAAIPVWIFTPALKLEINSTWMEPAISPIFLLGIGKKEIVTLGTKAYFFPTMDWGVPVFFDVFATAHISPHWSVFVGAELSSTIDYCQDGDGIPFFTVGIGYKIPTIQRKYRM